MQTLQQCQNHRQSTTLLDTKDNDTDKALIHQRKIWFLFREQTRKQSNKPYDQPYCGSKIHKLGHITKLHELVKIVKLVLLTGTEETRIERKHTKQISFRFLFVCKARALI